MRGFLKEIAKQLAEHQRLLIRYWEKVYKMPPTWDS